MTAANLGLRCECGLPLRDCRMPALDVPDAEWLAWWRAHPVHAGVVMRLRLTFEADVDPLAWGHYIARYPHFEGESFGDTLAREAIAVWDSEGLLAAGTEDPTYTAEILEDANADA